MTIHVVHIEVSTYITYLYLHVLGGRTTYATVMDE